MGLGPVDRAARQLSQHMVADTPATLPAKTLRRGTRLRRRRAGDEVLGVNGSSSEQDLKSAYRRLAHQYHPDKNRNDPQAEEKFKEAAEAYAVLSDPEQRRRYDRFGHAGVSSAASAAWGAPGFGGFEDILRDLVRFVD